MTTKIKRDILISSKQTIRGIDGKDYITSTVAKGTLSANEQGMEDFLSRINTITSPTTAFTLVSAFTPFA